MELNFKNKNIIITGGTRGIGRAIATLFLESGGNVTITGTKFKNDSELKKEWGFENIHYQRVNFLDDESINSFLKWIKGQDKIDILINNAGINKVNLNTETVTSDFDNLIDVNLKGPYLVSREVSIVMKKNKFGRIVNISSIWGVITRPERSIYTASKFGLVGLTKTLSVELASYGILVNAVAPGFTLTELTRDTNTELELQSLRNTIPINRLADPIEIARLVFFLSSEMNTYLTGQNIIIDGGFTNI